MNMNEFGPPGGFPGAPLDLPMGTICENSQKSYSLSLNLFSHESNII